MTAKYKVLCVDDSADSCRLLEAWLEDAPDEFELVTVQDPLSVRRIIEETRYDLYVLDIYMPELSGLALCRMIREKFPDSPIIVFSGDSYIHAPGAAIKAGANVYLTKPIEGEEFVSAVTRLIHANSEASAG
jgi:CheY-like chemotaxis protein